MNKEFEKKLKSLFTDQEIVDLESYTKPKAQSDALRLLVEIGFSLEVASSFNSTFSELIKTFISRRVMSCFDNEGKILEDKRTEFLRFMEENLQRNLRQLRLLLDLKSLIQSLAMSNLSAKDYALEYLVLYLFFVETLSHNIDLTIYALVSDGHPFLRKPARKTTFEDIEKRTLSMNCVS